jgi:3-hydroxyisobutyrate dehydrogenase-like beta-hydroxyacid dehydrogenase
MGLVRAAAMEAVAFGVAGGVAPATIAAAVGGESGFRREIGETAAQAAGDEILAQDVKFAELPYFLAQARAAGFALPLTAALRAFCEPAEDRWRDSMGRPSASFWQRLMHPRGETPGA